MIDSGSSSRLAFTWKVPTGTQVNRCWSSWRFSPLLRLISAKNSITPMTNAKIGVAQPSRCPQELVRLPPSSRTAALASGSRINRKVRSNAPVAGA